MDGDETEQQQPVNVPTQTNTAPDLQSNEFDFELMEHDEKEESVNTETYDNRPILNEKVTPFTSLEEFSYEEEQVEEKEEEEEEVYSTSTQTEMSLEQKFDPIILDLLVRDKDKVMAEISRLEEDKLTDDEREKFKKIAEKANLLLPYSLERTDSAFATAEAFDLPPPSLAQTGEPDEALLRAKANPLQMAMGYQERYLNKLDRAKANIQYELSKTGIYANEARKASIVSLMQQAQTNDALDLNTIDYIVFGGEFVPFYGAFLAVRDIPENVKLAREAWQEGKTGEAALYGGAMVIDVGASILGARVVAKGLKGKIGIKSQATIDKINSIKVADEAELSKRIKAADESAKANPEIAERLIKEFEKSIGDNSISKMVDGKLVLDFDAAKKQGLLIAKRSTQPTG